MPAWFLARSTILKKRHDQGQTGPCSEVSCEIQHEFESKTNLDAINRPPTLAEAVSNPWGSIRTLKDPEQGNPSVVVTVHVGIEIYIKCLSVFFLIFQSFYFLITS